MSISLKRIRAIFIKDYKEFSRNFAISVTLIVPIMLAVLFREIGSSAPEAIGFLLNISFVLITCFVQACLIAEEKERNTLRSLMMTPSTTMDILIGKSVLVFVMSFVVLTVATLIFGYQPANLWVSLAALILSIILYTSVGTICGLFSKTLLEASLSVIPVTIVFTAAPGRVLLDERFAMFNVLDYMPSSQLVHLLSISPAGYTMGEILKPLIIILLWTIVLTIVSVILYERRLKDE
ncbi:ABC transporter permease [Paenibacillus sp. ACRSA]|uniref:ABC transporter permease n=1 Tax=Paenibacillus sp. ACRSA TaxID=2918211 RepID=UPI001EF408CB|nr:ABC transporter permease [Paenibacillus sp. ACRSA]MCG7376986.1 ABC transporter permease [Paenibacillus sp. ACRSA]